MPKHPFLFSLDTQTDSILRRYLTPHALLRPYIAHYTIMLPYTAVVSLPLTLVPDVSGCIICSIEERQVVSSLWGPTTKTAVVGTQANASPCHLFVEFLPGGAHRLTGYPQQEFVDRIIPLHNCLPALDIALREVISHAQDEDELTRLLDTLFLSILSQTASVTPSAVTSLIKNAAPSATVKQLANAMCYSERHLNRLFYSEIGISAKNCLQLFRINKAMLLMQRRNLTLTECAQHAGYYDQSHFNREFREVCGIAPGAFLSNMSDFYNEKNKF